jgi:cation-transporting ATPase 13A2
MSRGITEEEKKNRQHLYGSNLIDIPIKSIPTMLIREVFHPFYLFQLFSCGLWLADEYYYYAAVILVMSSISITWTIVFTRKNLLRLREMAKVDGDVKVHRGGGRNSLSFPFLHLSGHS